MFRKKLNKKYSKKSVMFLFCGCFSYTNFEFYHRVDVGDVGSGASVHLYSLFGRCGGEGDRNGNHSNR